VAKLLCEREVHANLLRDRKTPRPFTAMFKQGFRARKP